MTAAQELLEILLVDDDPEVLNQLKELLPDHIADTPVIWECRGAFDEALALLKNRRFDILVSDIYRGRDPIHKNIQEGDAKAQELVDEIRAHRFCPIVLFTDGQVPPALQKSPFVWVADKSHPKFPEALIAGISEAINTGVPHIARRLHDELDQYAGSYLWEFLVKNWPDLTKRYAFDPEIMERIVRRRAAIHFGRLDGGAEPRSTVDPVDYYIYPPIGSDLRLGEIVKKKGAAQFRVILTPHCFLLTQPRDESPRATHVLTAATVPAEELRAGWKWQKGADGIADDLRRRTAFPASKLGSPDGRYCFLPAFMELPDLYCDLMQLGSLEIATVKADYDRIAVLDGPFAEALQASLARFYGAVGVPVLNADRTKHLAP